MTQRTDPRLITGALSMIRLPSWGLKANVVEMVRLLTVDAGADWAEVSRRDAAGWLSAGHGHARRLLDELVADQVLERRAIGGQRGHFYRFRDPRGWRRVPWRFRDDNAGERVPELVRHRLDACSAPVQTVDRAVVGLFDAQRRPATQNAVLGQPRRQARKLRDLVATTGGTAPQPDDQPRDLTLAAAPQIDVGPSSTSREPTGSAVARDEGEKTEEAGSAGRGDPELTGAALEVQRAIERQGRGTVKGKIKRKLEAAFRDVPVDLLGPILAAMESEARAGQRSPGLVDMAVAMIKAGAASVTPAITGKKPEVVLAELYDHLDATQRDLADAEADGDEGAAAYFRSVVESCHHRIAAITGEEATG